MKAEVLRFAVKRHGSSGHPAKGLFVTLLLCVCVVVCLISSAGASIVRYDVVSGVDNLGNPVSGSIYIDSEPGPDYWLGYDIVQYGFHSSALDYAGDQDGFITFFSGPGYPDPHYPEVVAGNSSIRLGDWGNAQAGVVFLDDGLIGCDQTVEEYSSLHEYIRVLDLNWYWNQSGAPRGQGTFLFQAAPVPVPSALLLLAPGLAGFMALRRRLRP